MARDGQLSHRRALLLLFFFLQIPSLLGYRSAHAVVDHAAEAAAGRRIYLPAPAVYEQSVEAVKLAALAHPRSMGRGARRSSSSAFMNAVSKHQVPSGANPDSN
ncbi:hypothetical protein BAE44_0015844 [Dichanthelium oligosanthes]|uniref:Uncharacterized protein n=1 Tax=Dichanthelium oligosanthes TaxID=888268 RepID=A0A1E5VDJ9_9POAL|nr:hypothetical protein BAE44_0015844 [Dichanthelium oligosanthes]